MKSSNNTNPNSIYMLINVCLERYNKYELCAYIDSGCSTYFEKKIFIFKINVEKREESFTNKNN